MAAIASDDQDAVVDLRRELRESLLLLAGFLLPLLAVVAVASR
jgi:hypothetical protein